MLAIVPWPGKLKQAIGRLNVPRLRAPEGRRFRIALAILAALGIGASVGSVAMLAAGSFGDATSNANIYYGVLDRLPPTETGYANRADEDLSQLATGATAKSLDEIKLLDESDHLAPNRELGGIDRLFGVDEEGPRPPNIANLQPGSFTTKADPQLLVAGIGGNLPIVDAAGRRPLDAYAIPSPSTDLPKIAIIVLDLGLDTKIAADSIQLPSQVGLGFSPYIAHGDQWHSFARSNGHETLLSLPVAHPAEARRDEGPLSLHPALSDTDMVTALNRVLVRGEGYVAMAARSGLFSGQSEAFVPIGANLAERGIGFVELGEPRLPAIPGLAHAVASVALDERLMPLDIENQLHMLERVAETNGQAIGFTRPFPIVFDRIWHWANDLERNRFNLVPVSAILRATNKPIPQ